MIRSYIKGEYKNSSSGKSFSNINPATGQEIDQVDQADQALFDYAIETSREAFIEWSSMPGRQRGRILNKASRLLREQNDELARLETLDTGKPLQESLVVDVSSGADCIEYFAGVASTINGEYINLGNSFAYTRREPLGICAGIGAWNYPIQIACWKSAPALACGNVMLFKPAELTPMTANRLAEVYTQAGLPDGVFNVIQGDAQVGRMMTADPQVSKVSLTGEVGTGKTTLCRAFLENLNENIHVAYIFNPELNSLQLLKAINDEFGITSTPDNTKDLIDILNAFLQFQTLQKGGLKK